MEYDGRDTGDVAEYFEQWANKIDAGRNPEGHPIDLASSLDSSAFCVALIISKKSTDPNECIRFYAARLALHVGRMVAELDNQKANGSDHCRAGSLEV